MALTRAKRSVSRAAAVAVGLVLTASPAWADAIDGEWCREGRHFVIEGPNIRGMRQTAAPGCDRNTPSSASTLCSP